VIGAGMAVVGGYMSPRVTQAIVAGLLTLFALKGLLWQLGLPHAESVETGKRPSVAPTSPALAPTPVKVVPAINWAPWKYRTQYTLYEFAKILAKTDPAAQSMNTEGSAYARLLLEDVLAKNLKYQPKYYHDFHGQPKETPPDYETSTPRPEAVKWAKEKISRWTISSDYAVLRIGS
jgi:hypothetical protein